MHYLGGKARVGNKIAEIINCNQFCSYWEPFVGAGWVAKEVNKENILLSDINVYLISLWKALQSGWTPPDTVSEAEYIDIKNNKTGYPSELVAFVGFGCSFGGKYFGGYCRDGKGRNYAKNARNSLLKKITRLKEAKFEVVDFNQSSLNLKDTIIYCDPPYQGTTGYDYVGNFDSDLFWEKCREYSRNNYVLISEYQSPEDFHAIASFPTRTDMRNKAGKMDVREEKIFMYRGKN